LEWINLVLAAILLATLFLAYKLIVIKWLKGKMDRKEIPPDASSGILMVIRLTTLIAGIMILLWGIGVSSTSLGLIAAILTLTIAFASQQTLGNFMAGIYLILVHPFHVGDFVHFGTSGNIEGIVKQINLNYTRIHTKDDIYFLLSNQQVLSKEILNYRFTEGETLLYRVPIKLDFDYTLSVQQINQILLELIERYKGELPKAPKFYPIGFDDDVMKFVFVLYVKDPEEIFELKPQFIEEILEAREKIKSQPII